MPCASLPGLPKIADGGGRAREGSKKFVMAGDNIGRNPGTKGGRGIETAGPETEEAGPRVKRLAFTCWNDGVANYVEPGWEWFTCWRCGSLVYTA
jgi:hypothetical protein